MAEFVHQVAAKIKKEAKKIIVGQDKTIELILVGLLAKGHLLIEGVPGIAKTLIAKVLARILNARFTRIQFTPDLMPSDIIGTNVFDIQTSTFTIRRGPIFTDILLADEINRTPPKTQSALLEAMEERQVSIDGDQYAMTGLFIVLATQNPIEYEGTYPLPEAQLDRFLLKILMEYPTPQEETEILERYREDFNPQELDHFGLAKLPDPKIIQDCRDRIKKVTVEDSILRYIYQITAETRRSTHLSLGGSPRASISLLQTSRSMAALRGQGYVSPDEVKEMAKPVFRHRLILNPESELEGMTTDDVVEQVLRKVEVPR